MKTNNMCLKQLAKETQTQNTKHKTPTNCTSNSKRKKLIIAPHSDMYGKKHEEKIKMENTIMRRMSK